MPSRSRGLAARGGAGARELDRGLVLAAMGPAGRRVSEGEAPRLAARCRVN